MSAYDNVVGGKLKLKGKALDVKAGGVKKKKKQKKREDEVSKVSDHETSKGGSIETSADPDEQQDSGEKSSEVNNQPRRDDNLTPAERRYIEQRARLDVNKLAKDANKSHRDRIQDFNQYLANMSEHYDIPKVGPG